MSITPAFSPGPWITQGAWVGKVRRWIFDDLYEQCSFHMAEKMPSSVKVGARPIRLRMRSYSSRLRPWAATRAALILVVGGVVFGVLGDLRLVLSFFSDPTFRAFFSGAGRTFAALREGLETLAMRPNVITGFPRQLTTTKIPFGAADNA